MPDLSDKVSEPCPWCGSTPQFKFREPGGRDGAYELPLRAFGCTNKGCPVQPHTRWENIGHFVAEKHCDVRDDEAGLSHITAWNRRTRPPASSVEGWRIVPEEMTKTMRQAFNRAQEQVEEANAVDDDGHVIWSPDHQWKAVLGASPIPPEVMK